MTRIQAGASRFCSASNHNSWRDSTFGSYILGLKCVHVCSFWSLHGFDVHSTWRLPAGHAHPPSIVHLSCTHSLDYGWMRTAIVCIMGHCRVRHVWQVDSWWSAREGKLQVRSVHGGRLQPGGVNMEVDLQVDCTSR